MKNIKIRKANSDDAEIIADLKLDGYRTAYRGILDDDFIDSMDRAAEIRKRRDINESGVNIIIADLDNEALGYCLFRNFNREQEKYPDIDCELSALYVRSDMKRNGIGTQLFQNAMAQLAAAGKKKMILGCLKENYSSRAFYEKMGGIIRDYTEAAFGSKMYELAMYEFNLQK